ncbi:hypothetical protein CPB84DRAFT_1783087 [Gymnopilus junonius]|uniref:F-box domain-containing protein n=1 Tax=Gymnopilus junonius TaxID=109634 RepID=A0A9P5NLI4_GYMJU|nr:hypothetical protein CPB84DRAFT_1783087 [Gymnopilus junonius]
MYRCYSCSSLDTLDPHPDGPYVTCGDEYCSPCGRFDILNDQISQINSSLAALVDERQGLRSQLNNIHQSIVHRLPLEISTIIFSLYVHGLGDPENPTPRKLTDSPLVLGAVCRTWRQIGWSVPYLWTSLTMELGPRIGPTRIQLATTWLCRSGQTPLSIKLYNSLSFEK